jgi:hypothetical protein
LLLMFCSVLSFANGLQAQDDAQAYSRGGYL